MKNMPGDKYCLSWGGHEKNLFKAFCDLRRDEHYCDVTIACEDLQFQAHRVVLTASSQIFNCILKKHSHPYPLLYLSGVKASDMKLLLDFMYSGEVTVEVDHLQSFMAAAEQFKVQGLNNNQSQELQSKLSVQPPGISTTPTSIYKDDPLQHIAKTAEESPFHIPELLQRSPAFSLCSQSCSNKSGGEEVEEISFENMPIIGGCCYRSIHLIKII